MTYYKDFENAEFGVTRWDVVYVCAIVLVLGIAYMLWNYVKKGTK